MSPYINMGRCKKCKNYRYLLKHSYNICVYCAEKEAVIKRKLKEKEADDKMRSFFE